MSIKDYANSLKNGYTSGDGNGTVREYANNLKLGAGTIRTPVSTPSAPVQTKPVDTSTFDAFASAIVDANKAIAGRPSSAEDIDRVNRKNNAEINRMLHPGTSVPAEVLIESAQRRMMMYENDPTKSAEYEKAVADYNIGLQKADSPNLGKVAKIVGKNVWADAGVMTHGLADLTLGNLAKGFDYVAGTNTAEFFDKNLEWAKEQKAEVLGELEKEANGSKGVEVGAQVATAVIEAIPAAVLALMTGGTSAATTGALNTASTAAGLSGASKVAYNAANIAKTMAKNPNYWTSFAQETGRNYADATEWAKNDSTAAAYALLTSLITSGVEIGLDGASGIQGLANEVRAGNPSRFIAWLKSSIEEGNEEVVQSLINRGMQILFGNEDAKVESLEDVGNLAKELGGEWAMGTAVGGLLGGATQSISNLVQKIGEPASPSPTPSPAATVLAPETSVNTTAEQNGTQSVVEPLNEDVLTRVLTGDIGNKGVDTPIASEYNVGKEKDGGLDGNDTRTTEENSRFSGQVLRHDWQADAPSNKRTESNSDFRDRNAKNGADIQEYRGVTVATVATPASAVSKNAQSVVSCLSEFGIAASVVDYMEYNNGKTTTVVSEAVTDKDGRVVVMNGTTVSGPESAAHEALHRGISLGDATALSAKSTIKSNIDIFSEEIVALSEAVEARHFVAEDGRNIVHSPEALLDEVFCYIAGFANDGTLPLIMGGAVYDADAIINAVNAMKTNRVSTGDALVDAITNGIAPQANVEAETTGIETEIAPPTEGGDGLGAANYGFTGDTVRGFSENLATDANMEQDIREDYRLDPEMYFRLGNKETLNKAQEIFDKGVDEARREVEAALVKSENGMKLAPEMIPLARMVANELSRNGDLDGARNILSRTAVQLTEAGQLGQAANILRNADPASVIMTVEEAIARIEEALPRNSKWHPQLTAAEIEMIRNTDFTQEGAFEAVWDSIAQRLGAEMPSTFWEKLTEIRRISMLLNPKTQVKNVVGNVPMAGARKVSERLSGAIQGALVKMGVMKAEDRTRTFKQSKESRNLAKELFEANKERAKNSSNRWDMAPLLRQYRKYFGASKMGQAADAVRTFTYELLEMGDNPFLKSAFVDSAAGYIEAQGYTTIDQVPQSVIDFAMQNALEATFKDASQLASIINEAKRKGGVGGALLDILFPFTTTPINIARRTFEYSPLNALTVANDIARGEAASKIVDDISKTLTGSAIVGIGWLLRNLGAITGGADEDEDKAAFDKATGTSPYSFGGKYSYEWAQPVGTLLALGAEVADVISGDQTTMDGFLNALYTSGDSFLEMSFFKNVLDAFKGYGSPTEKVLEEAGTSLVSQLVPSVFGATARVFDDTVRTSYTGGGVGDDILAQTMIKTPFASKNLPASVNVKGEENKRAGNVFARAALEYLSPGNLNVAKKTETDAAIEGVYEATGDKTIFPSVANRKIEYKDNDFVLTGKEYAEVQTTRGQTYYDLADLLFSKDNIPAESQADILYMANTYAEAVAKQEYLEGKGVDYDITGEAATVEKAIASGDPIEYLFVRGSIEDELKKTNPDYDLVAEFVDRAENAPEGVRNALEEDTDYLPAMITVTNSGMDLGRWFAARKKYTEIYNEDLAPDKQVKKFDKWVREQGYSRDEIRVINKTIDYYWHIGARR